MSEPTDPTARRGFLRGRFRSGPPPLRPPGALVDAHFTERCSRCGDCARACPTRIIIQGDGGFPTLDFQRGECTFCGDCISACTSAALVRPPCSNDKNTLGSPDGPVAWNYRASIGDSCLAERQTECRICGEACPESAIRFPPRLGRTAAPNLILDRCTGCGACVAPCPVACIRIVELPPEG